MNITLSPCPLQPQAMLAFRVFLKILYMETQLESSSIGSTPSSFSATSLSRFPLLSSPSFSARKSGLDVQPSVRRHTNMIAANMVFSLQVGQYVPYSCRQHSTLLGLLCVVSALVYSRLDSVPPFHCTSVSAYTCRNTSNAC